jgi:hypothetical protein
MSKAIKKAIKRLREYADDDEISGLHGNGCYSNPTATIEEWIKEIEKLEQEEK